METTKCPSTDEWIKKMWYRYTMEYGYLPTHTKYSQKKNEVLPFATIWMDLENIVLGKSDRERQTLYVFTYIWNLNN